jgi:hypothetical protein
MEKPLVDFQRDGEIGFAGPARDLISNEKVLSSYLGH